VITQRNHRRGSAIAVAVALTGSLVLSSCTAADDSDVVTITLAGPNQWNDSGESFGEAWEDLIARFEAEEPGIKVETVVLPIATFGQVLSTQLSAGTAPELVYSQAPHEPHMVHALDEYLTEPNPYVEGNERWIDVFNPRYFSLESGQASGRIEAIPFDLTGVGLSYNADIFEKAGVEAPIATYADLIDACTAISAAGYTPFAMDGSFLGPAWTAQVIFNMMVADYIDDINVYAADGTPGSAPQVTAKSMAAAVLGGTLSTSTPEVEEFLVLIKEVFDACATPNWSGIPASSGAIIGIQEYLAGEAGMAWATVYSYDVLKDASFTVGGMPFPTITSDSTPLASGAEAQFGVAPGTQYMISSTTEGAKLDATIKFLQFVSAPQHVEPWLKASGGNPAVLGIEGPEASKAYLEGAWAEPMATGGNTPWGPSSVSILSAYDGYLLGSKSLDEQKAYLQDLWEQQARELVETNGWQSESWAQ
jgi:ABC-type sugar transport system, periplasmic component